MLDTVSQLRKGFSKIPIFSNGRLMTGSAQKSGKNRAGASLPPAGRTLATEIYGRLLADITSGRLLPRQRLAFDMLRGTYKCSVTTLREALQRLSGEGLVDARGHIGFSVADVSVKELTDLNGLRLMLEPLALKESIASGDADWEARVVISAHKLQQMPIPADLHSASADLWEDAHRELHDALISACTNATLLQFSRTLFQQVRRYRRVFLRRYWISVEVRAPVEHEHRAIVDAALRRDAEAAAEALHVHYSNGFGRMLNEYRETQHAHSRLGGAVR